MTGYTREETETRAGFLTEEIQEDSSDNQKERMVWERTVIPPRRFHLMLFQCGTDGQHHEVLAHRGPYAWIKEKTEATQGNRPMGLPLHAWRTVCLESIDARAWLLADDARIGWLVRSYVRDASVWVYIGVDCSPRSALRVIRQGMWDDAYRVLIDSDRDAGDKLTSRDTETYARLQETAEFVDRLAEGFLSWDDGKNVATIDIYDMVDGLAHAVGCEAVCSTRMMRSVRCYSPRLLECWVLYWLCQAHHLALGRRLTYHVTVDEHDPEARVIFQVSFPCLVEPHLLRADPVDVLPGLTHLQRVVETHEGMLLYSMGKAYRIKDADWHGYYRNLEVSFSCMRDPAGELWGDFKHPYTKGFE